jgi:hypothetical protein
MFECLKKFWNMICNLFINAKFNLIDRRKNAPKNIIRDISRSQIGEAVLSGTNRKPKVYLSDQKYNLASVEDIKNILSMDDTDRAKYVAETYDCDEFAYRLMGQFSTPEWAGFAFGIMWVQTPSFRHAVNCFVDNELQFWVIEPQNDRIFKLPEDWNPFVVFM